MKNRSGLPPLTIPSGSFDTFNRGATIEVRVHGARELQIGDEVAWECGTNHTGRANVIEHTQDSATISRVGACGVDNAQDDTIPLCYEN